MPKPIYATTDASIKISHKRIPVYYIENKELIDFIINKVKQSNVVIDFITIKDATDFVVEFNGRKCTQIIIKIKNPTKREFVEKITKYENEIYDEIYLRSPVVDKEKRQELIRIMQEICSGFRFILDDNIYGYLTAITFVEYKAVTREDFLAFDGKKYMEG